MCHCDSSVHADPAELNKVICGLLGRALEEWPRDLVLFVVLNCCVTLGMSLNLSIFRYPHVQNGDYDRCCFYKVFGALWVKNSTSALN